MEISAHVEPGLLRNYACTLCASASVFQSTSVDRTSMRILVGIYWLKDHIRWSFVETEIEMCGAAGWAPIVWRH